MRTPRPAAGATLAFLELTPHALDVTPPRLGLLHGLDPTDPLVARERGDVLPGRKRLRVGQELLLQVRRYVMDDARGDGGFSFGLGHSLGSLTRTC